MAKESLYIDVIIQNSGDENIECVIDKSFNEDFIDKADDYKLSINKFSLPASAITKAAVNPNLTYQTFISYPKYSLNGISNRFDGYLQKSQNLYSYSEYAFDNSEELLENVNRTLLKNFKDICTTTSKSTGNFTLSNGAKTHTLVVSGIGHSRVGMLEVEMILPSITQAHPTSLKLTSPAGKTCYLYMNDIIDDNNTIGLTKVVFGDGYIKPFENELKRGSTQYCYPAESLTSNFHNDSTDGNWVVEFENLEADEIELNATMILHFYHFDHQDRLHQLTSNDVPYFSYDRSDELIVCNIPEAWVNYGLRFGFNQNLDNIMNFTTIKNPNPASGSDSGEFLYLQVPQVPTYTEALTDVITVSQNRSSLFQTKRYPSRIIIESDMKTRRILNCHADEEQPSANAMLEEFLIDPEAFNGSDFIFNTRVLREHDILSSEPMYRISMAVKIEYEDGVHSPLMIEPGQRAFIQLQFNKYN